MMLNLRAATAATALLIAILGSETGSAQNPSGVLKMYSLDSPPSLSMLDGLNLIARTIAPVFNNLVMFDQHVKQKSLASIVPYRATGWSWNEEGTVPTLPFAPRCQMA